MDSPVPRTVAVVYGFGSVSPTTIVREVEPEARVLFVTDTRDPHCAAVAPLLQALAPVVDLAAGGDLRGAGVDGIVTFSEAQLRTTAALAQELGLPQHSVDTAAALTDKSRQRALLNAAGVSVTRHEAVADTSELCAAAGRVGYPVVVKPVHGDSGRYTVRCADERELVAAIDTVLPFRVGTGERSWEVEELLRPGRHPAGEWLGDYVSVETVSVAGTGNHFTVCDKLPLAAPFRERGTIIPSSLSGELRDEVVELAGDALRALDVRVGITHTEIKLTPDGPRVIEVNGRLGGGIARLMSRCSDTSPVRLAVRAALGRPVSDRPAAFDRAALLYLALPPMDRVRVRRIVDEPFRRIAGVWEVEPFAERGTVLDWRNGLADRMFSVRAEAPDHEALAAVVAELDGAAAGCADLEPV